MDDRAACPVCERREKPRWREEGWFRCRACGTLVREVMPTQADLDKLYDESWTQPDTFTSETGGTNPRVARLYVRRLMRSLGLEDFNGLRVLDFGAGRGDMLAALRERGASVTGIDPFGWRFLRDQGYEAYPSLEALPADRVFDGAITIDVVEHLPECWRQLDVLRCRLAPGGWLMVSTANADSLLARLTRGKWREARRAGHLMLFPPRGMELIMERGGWRKYRRLRWFVDYDPKPHRRLLHWTLQAVGLDGEVRYLARREPADEPEGGSAGD